MGWASEGGKCCCGQWMDKDEPQKLIGISLSLSLSHTRIIIGGGGRGGEGPDTLFHHSTNISTDVGKE